MYELAIDLEFSVCSSFNKSKLTSKVSWTATGVCPDGEIVSIVVEVVGARVVVVVSAVSRLISSQTIPLLFRSRYATSP